MAYGPYHVVGETGFPDSRYFAVLILLGFGVKNGPPGLDSSNAAGNRLQGTTADFQRISGVGGVHPTPDLGTASNGRRWLNRSYIDQKASKREGKQVFVRQCSRNLTYFNSLISSSNPAHLDDSGPEQP